MFHCFYNYNCSKTYFANVEKGESLAPDTSGALETGREEGIIAGGWTGDGGRTLGACPPTFPIPVIWGV